MYPNLELEMKKSKIKRKDIAELLDMRPATITEKLNGKTSVSVIEAAKIQDSFFPDYSIDYLFKTWG